MSYTGMLAHRCRVKELRTTFEDGIATSDWVTVATDVKCFLDLGFIRKGKDPIWTPEAGRASDRSGVLFADRKVTIVSGARIEMTRGPSGAFTVEGAVDEAWTPKAMHHLELGVVEIPKQISGAV